MTIQHITASLNQKLIANADRFYTANLGQMIDEIVQNARRAGARTLTVELDHDVLTIRDDGRGLTAEQAPVLLQLGGSNNTETVESAENAAGIGFFSMAHADVVVRSHDWRMTVPRAAFTGRTSATLERGQQHLAGLSLTLTGLEKRPDYAKLTDGSLLVEATRYSGLRLTLIGFGPFSGTHEPRDFLADRTPAGSETIDLRHAGLTIKLVRRESNRATSKSPFDFFSYSTPSSKIVLNFFGKVIEVANRDWTTNFVAEEIATLTVKDNGVGSFEISQRVVDVLVDVHDTSVLRMQLPERNTPIYDDGYKAIGAIVSALYRDLLASLDGPNGVPMNASVRRDLGARLRPPQLQITCPLRTRYDEQIRTVGISTPTGIQTRDGTIIPFAACVCLYPSDMISALLKTGRAQDSVVGRTFLSRPDVEKAYGPGIVPAAESAALVIKDEGEEHRIDLEHNSLDEVYAGLDESGLSTENGQVDDAALILTVDGAEFVTSIPGIVASQYDDGDGIVLMVRGQEPDAIVRLMLDTLDWWNEETDYKSELSTTRDVYHTVVAQIVGTSADLMRERIARAVRNEVYDFISDVPKDGALQFTVTITRGAHGLQVVTAPLAA